MKPTPVPSVERELICFGQFELDVETGELWRAEKPIPLRPLAGRALIALADRAGHVVSRDELRRVLWPDAAVAWDQGLNQCIRQIRRALGDDAGAPLFVETVPRRGYRFKAAVVRRRGKLSERRGSAAGSGSRAMVAFLAGAAATLAIPAIVLVICAVVAGR